MADLLIVAEGRRSSPGDAAAAPAQRERRTPCRGLFGEAGELIRRAPGAACETAVIERWSARLNRVPVLP